MLNGVMDFIGFGVNGGGVSAEPPVLTYLANATDGTNTTGYTFSTQPLGTPAADRRIFVLVYFYAASGGITSVTVGGTALTAVVSTVADGASGIALYSAIIAAGETGDVVVTISATASACAIGIWSATGLKDSAKTAQDTSAATTSDTLTIEAPLNSIVIAGAANQRTSAPGDVTISNVTEDFDTGAFDTTKRVVAGSTVIDPEDATYDMAIAWTTSTLECALAMSWK